MNQLRLIKRTTLQELRERGVLKYAYYMRVLIILVTIVLCGAFFQKCVALDKSIQISQGPIENPPIIKENTVVFFAISQTDYDFLVSEKPELSERMEELNDYYRYSFRIISKLKEFGITVIAGTWKEVTVQLGKRKTKKIQFNSREFKAILMYGKGKAPKLVTGFTGNYESMAKILSDYFHIDYSIW